MLDGTSNIIVLYAENCMICQKTCSKNDRIHLYNDVCRRLIEFE